MDTEGPVSVLDRRPRSSSRDRVIADRITRQRSPGPAFRHHRGRRVPSLDGSFAGEEDTPDVVYRISQPYRTSFSAKHSVTWGKADRSRSLSPTSSLRSDVSYASAPPVFLPAADKRRPRGRSKSPKRVTYNTRVTVRHSDTDDSMFTELSSHEGDDGEALSPRGGGGGPKLSPFSRALISPRYNEFSQLSPIGGHESSKTSPGRIEPRPRVRDVTNLSYGDYEDLSRDSGLDYSSELKDLSDQITKMQWSPGQNRAVWGRPPPAGAPRAHVSYCQAQLAKGNTSHHGILKDSQNSRSGVKENGRPKVLSDGNGNNGHGHINGSVTFTDQTVGSPMSPSSNGLYRTNKGKENDPRTSPGTTNSISSLDRSSPTGIPDFIARDYEHDRHFNHTDALKGDYGDDISKLARELLREAGQAEDDSDHPPTDNGTGNRNGGLNITNGSSYLPQTNDVEQHGDDIVSSSSPADTSQGETSPGRGSPVESGRLTPSKRSVSLSITNFLKRVSPHFRRKRSKERSNKSRSADGSAQSLANTTSDPDTDRDSPTNALTDKPKRPGKFSRSQVRQSFMKLVGRSSSKSKKKSKKQPEGEAIIPTPSHYTIELQDPERNTSSDEVDEISNGFILNSHDNLGNGSSGFDPSTHRMMKSIEQNRVSEQDIYRRFKERNSSRDSTDHPLTDVDAETTLKSTSLAKPEPIRPTTSETTSALNDTTTSELSDSPMDFFTESDIVAILRPDLDRSHLRAAYFQMPEKLQEVSPSRAEPPSTLDVVPPRTSRLMQTSVMSSISGDESIGDCSLDANMTASEPSLLSGISQSGVSKQIVIPSSLVNSTEGQLTSDPEVVKLRRPNNRQEQSNKENNVPDTGNKPRSDPPSPVDPNHKPSYLKLSCAVSGYGKYSRYSTYKDVNKRSPYSSQSSLRSDGSSSDPAMPAEQRSGDESTPEHRLRSPATLAVNGHVPKYPIGDTTKDGEYFIQHTKFEEERIQGLCQRAEAHMRSHDLPEEACGRIRAATGKANLLITQKFGQFRDLCQNHMKPDPDERETKWEDLQGFWDMVKIQIDHVDDMFAEIEMMKDNGWQEVPRLASRRSSASSSPKSGSLSQASTPSATPAHTPGSRRKNLKVNSGKDTPDSSPERNQKARLAAKARDDARKKLLAERRAAMKQATTTTTATNNGEGGEVEIYLPEPAKK